MSDFDASIKEKKSFKNSIKPSPQSFMEKTLIDPG